MNDILKTERKVIDSTRAEKDELNGFGILSC